jgi:hypothetical protein
MKTAIENAGLTTAEQDVLITSLKPYHGWQSDVARRHVNPQTNQPYTRAWTNAVLPKIHRKVRAAYGGELS